MVRSKMDNVGQAIDRDSHPEPQRRVRLDNVPVEQRAMIDLAPYPQLPRDVRVDGSEGPKCDNDRKDDERGEKRTRSEKSGRGPCPAGATGFP